VNLTSSLRWTLAAWLILGGAYAAIIDTQSAGTMGAALSLRVAFVTTFAPAAMSLGILMLTGRFAWPERRVVPFAAVHVCLAIVFALVWTGSMLLVATGDPSRMPRDVVMTRVLPWHLVMGVLWYGLIAGSSYAARGALQSRDLRVSVERAERLRAEAELAALRAHVNPHFLFNTLHSVSELLRRDAPAAERVIERLASVFRYAVRLDRWRMDTVSLEEEWQFIENYLCLEQLRMGDRLRIDVTLDDEALACAIPPFTLQPLVENAVRHGIGPKVAGGTLFVRAVEEDAQLVITVADDGVGADMTALSSGTGLGLRSVRQRLHAKHGQHASVHVHASRGRGVRVTLRFPAVAAG